MATKNTNAPIVNDTLIDWVIKEEGFLDKPTNIGDGKITLGSGLTAQKWRDKYRKNGNKWTKQDNRAAVREELESRRRWAEDTIPNWENLPDDTKRAMLSYKYNYDFAAKNSPKLFSAMKSGDYIEAVRQMDATSKDSKFKKGLQERRNREQAWGLGALIGSNAPIYQEAPSVVEYPDNTRVFNPYTPLFEEVIARPALVPTNPTTNYVEVRQAEPEEWQQDDALAAFRMLERAKNYRDSMLLKNQPELPQREYNPTEAPYLVTRYDEGGSLDKKKTWDELSVKEKADMMKVAVENGITSLSEIKDRYNEFAEGGDTEETYEGRTLPEVEVTAPRKWFVGYDENGNPVYTTDYKQSQEYLQNQIPLSDIEQSRRQWAFENKGANGQVRPGLHGDAADLALAAELGVGTALSPFAYKGITGLLSNPIADAALTADGVINTPSRIKEGIGDISNGDYGSAVWNLGTTALDILGGANLARKATSLVKSRRIPKITPENAASITPEQWTAAQDAAIARGDMAEAQRLRDLHFETSSEVVPKLVYRGGKYKNPRAGTTYHYQNNDTSREPWIFHESDLTPQPLKYLDADRGIYFTDSYPYAELFSGSPERIGSYYLRVKSPYTAEEPINFKYVMKKYKEPEFHTKYDGIVGKDAPYYTSEWYDKEQTVWDGDQGNISVIRTSNNAKLSDAVTYGDDGVRIPLGERDNFNINDVRYGLLPFILGGAAAAKQ